ncbi:protein CBFA2T1-like isoform X2 [Antedon mediterranea]|uniref:protein CBFA2T1-like isoform X2 n=1 Tax=Antedon mediterranea TaxID=105859 RepID=UPI003AF93980
MRKNSGSPNQSLNRVDVKKEQDVDAQCTQIPSSIPGPVMPATVKSEQKTISLSKLMHARAQKNNDYYHGTGVFSFEFHRQPNTNPLEGKMPDSPIDAALVKHPSQCSPNMVQTNNMVASHPRPVSTGSSTGAPALNGVPSPHHSTPSPPGHVNGQELPPACGARQLSKLKRFLTTLQQFGNDISPEIGERVRGLVMGLVNNHLTVEEFHNKLQEATNFPLRPFVIPFLKTNLPLLQRELMHCARMAKMTPQQYYMQHENQLLGSKTSPVETEVLMDVNENGKRRTPEERISNGPKDLRSEHSAEHPAPKRRCSGSPGSGHQNGPPGNHFSHMPPHQIRMEDLAHAREMRDMRERFEREHGERHRHSSFSSRDLSYPDHLYFEGRGEDDWKHVETMLECIVGMVDKTKRAINMLRQRSIQDREELALWARRHAEGTENDIKKRVGDMMAHTFRQTDDRVSDVKRRAEEAVNEVKRQAVTELQKAVQAAESKANKLVAAERAKLDRAVLDAKRTATEEALTVINSQDSSSESCWNCGRKANETCSGCNTARYCGSFCQHKDWENHHKMCGKLASQNNSTESSATAATTTSPVPTSPSKNSSPPDPNTTSKSRSSTPNAPNATSVEASH